VGSRMAARSWEQALFPRQQACPLEVEAAESWD
jgi:hypothetical protein